jgi:hypothetical protein
MELPQGIKTLYKHWPLHTTSPKSQRQKEIVPQEILSFVKERVNIWERKIAGNPPPLTSDPILAKYRFCNILRELDKQTIYFHTLLNPLRSNPPLWILNMFYCRMIARPETIASTGLLSFDKKANKKVYELLINHARPKFGTPYVFPVSVIQKSPTPTRELFLTKHLPIAAEPIATEIQSWYKKSVYDGLQKILPIFGYNLKFLWTEVLIDAAYQFPEKINLFDRFPIGPGALPTFKKLDPIKDPSLLAQSLGMSNTTVDITYEGSPIKLSAENWEGIACEYRKYSNLKKGKGRKRIYE